MTKNIHSMTDSVTIYERPVELLHHTVSPNIMRGANKYNVISSEITVDLVGRLRPGYTPDDMLLELQSRTAENSNWRL